MDADHVVNVVRRVIGSVYPVHEHYTDTARLNNLKVLTEVIDILVGDVAAVADHNHGDDASAVALVNKAQNFLYDLNEATHEWGDE